MGDVLGGGCGAHRGRVVLAPGARTEARVSDSIQEWGTGPVLGAERREGETWRQCAERNAIEAGGLGAEVLEEFDRMVSEGAPEDRACFAALWEWDCLSFVESVGARETG